MPRKRPSKKAQPAEPGASPRRAARPSALLDTRIIYCGDCVDQLAKLPDGCVDLIYIDPPFNSNRNYEVFWGETKEKRAFEDRHASTQAYIDYMRPRCVFILFLLAAMLMTLLLAGCDSDASSKASREARDRYGEKIDTIKSQVDNLGTQIVGELGTTLEDVSLSRERKTAKLVAVLDRMLSKIDFYSADLQQIQPPSDLIPLHKFFLSDLQTFRSLFIDFRDALKLQDQDRINAVGERMSAHDRDRKDKLRAAYWDSGLADVDTVSSFKDAIAKRKLGTGVRFWGLPINTWLVFAWFAMACIHTHNKRIWQAAARGELPPGDEQPPGWLFWIVIPQYSVFGYLFYLDWQQALSVYVGTFLAAIFLSLILETIGAILLIPFTVLYKMARRRQQ